MQILLFMTIFSLARDILYGLGNPNPRADPRDPIDAAMGTVCEKPTKWNSASFTDALASGPALESAQHSSALAGTTLLNDERQVNGEDTVRIGQGGTRRALSLSSSEAGGHFVSETESMMDRHDRDDESQRTARFATTAPTTEEDWGQQERVSDGLVVGGLNQGHHETVMQQPRFVSPLPRPLFPPSPSSFRWSSARLSEYPDLQSLSCSRAIGTNTLQQTRRYSSETRRTPRALRIGAKGPSLSHIIPSPPLPITSIIIIIYYRTKPHQFCVPSCHYHHSCRWRVELCDFQKSSWSSRPEI
jgi:hypothetical protein